MQLSIIIVNYNVKYFLEQCLSSVCKAIQSLDAEVWVVDNASNDGSIEFLQPRYPSVKFIVNDRNVGFAQANNHALYECSGDYVLFLNPDTIVPEDCFTKCLHFFEDVENAGALGVRMVDGQGIFLPESKRSFPSPFISFFKLVGLTALFPKSRLFAKYNLGYLDQHKNHEVDVLAGAFLLAKRELLQQLNGFDEAFFMYGEDVDLSYRIQQTGLRNYYFSGTTIIHFKGESTKKGSLNYVRMFYQAMSTFVRKHYGGGKASIFIFFIQLAIWLRAGLSALSWFIVKIGLPIVDVGLVFGSFHFVNTLWVDKVRAGDGFRPELINVVFPAFTFLFITTAWLAGMYDRRSKTSKAFYAALVATVVVLATYSLLPDKYRFSRGVILLGSVTATLLIVLFRWLLLQWKVMEDTDETNKQQQTLVAGTREEYEEVKQLLKKSGLQKRIMGRIAANGNKEDAISTLDQLETLLQSIRPREIIFCEGYLTYEKIIQAIQQLPPHINARFHSANSVSIVGSDSKDTSGEMVTSDGSFELSQPFQRRRKRLVDVAIGLIILLSFPVHLMLSGKRAVYNSLLVVAGKRTWVGYSQANEKLPELRRGVLATNGFPVNASAPFKKESLLKIDEWYARNYNWMQDIKFLLKHYKKLG